MGTAIYSPKDAAVRTAVPSDSRSARGRCSQGRGLANVSELSLQLMQMKNSDGEGGSGVRGSTWAATNNNI